MAEYSKPWLSVDAQIERLTRRRTQPVASAKLIPSEARASRRGPR